MIQASSGTATATFLAATALVVTACDGGRPAGSPPAPATSPASPTTSAAGGADAALKQAFSTREALGSGAGQLEPHVGNSLATTPKSVLSVTFAFVCTGGAAVTLQVGTVASAASSTKATQKCDGSILQRSVELPKPGAVTFEGDVTGTQPGGFAYGYYVEKKRLS
ncbi:hypothetical protein [Krasilnikovia sp. M28-CT-15]|uniref:hypothetical protein n=1 Tax=Krasilnikovia sp. M28-CT-15 TaxID=3373540 RepID=UPI0038772C60